MRKVLSLAVLFVCLPAFASEPAQTDRITTFSDTPVFLEPDDETAILYLANPHNVFWSGLSKKRAVYLDDKPFGYLRPKSYIASAIEPGYRALVTMGWGHKKRLDWYEFAPGTINILVAKMDYVDSHGTSQSGMPQVTTNYVFTGWERGSASDPHELVESLGLKHVTTTEKGMAALRKKGWGKWIAKRIEEEGEVQTELPFEAPNKMACRLDDIEGSTSTERKLKHGQLTVNRERLVWESKERRIEIPITDIEDIEGGQDGYNISIRYGSKDNVRTIVLYPGRSQYKRVFWHVMEARDLATEKARSNTSAHR